MDGNKEKTASKPIFSKPVIENFTGYRSGGKYRLISIDGNFKASEDDLKTITKICNEELVYRFLFQDRLKGSPYLINDALKFVIWARDCWEKSESFFFLIRDEDNHIVACLDINSNNLENAAIGYWATKNHPGVMTNAVNRLCALAKEAGYKKFYALVEPVNIRSIGVLQRAGFTYTGTKMDEILFMDRPLGKQLLFNMYEKSL
jgi:RimJ/RimL family protein N-acetyltransferase